MEPKIIQPDNSGNGRGGAETPLAKKLAAFLVIIVIAGAALFAADWLRKMGGEKEVLLPDRLPDAVGVVFRIDGDSLWAERQIRNEDEKYKPAILEILTRDTTVFASIAENVYPAGATAKKIERSSLKAGDIIFVWVPVRPFAETLKNPMASELAIPLEEMLANPRERLMGEYIAVVGK